MFVQHSVHIARPIEECHATLVRDPRRWFPRLGEQATYAVGPKVAGVPFRKSVRVETGKPVKIGDYTEVPITWRATSIKGLFPVMDGKIELAPVDPDVTRLTVCGMYDPPLGRFGKHIDDAVMHRVAEATVKELAESIAKRLMVAPADPRRPQLTKAVRP
ncbi:MAG TPA: SRPBCC family protein [Candidatus Dormibacteraeota bacterium]|jgi:hypothetical protein